jgi:hypothetical protein
MAETSGLTPCSVAELGEWCVNEDGSTERNTRTWCSQHSGSQNCPTGNELPRAGDQGQTGAWARTGGGRGGSRSKVGPRYPGYGTPSFYLELSRRTTEGYRKSVAAGESDYLTSFGFKYAVWFSELRGTTSDIAVQVAIDQILIALQDALIIGIERNGGLLGDPNALGRFAFGTHVAAYEKGGFGTLWPGGQVEFLGTISLRDMGAYGIGPASGVVLGGLGMALFPRRTFP